jgi:hypothetical protein
MIHQRLRSLSNFTRSSSSPLSPSPHTYSLASVTLTGEGEGEPGLPGSPTPSSCSCSFFERTQLTLLASSYSYSTRETRSAGAPQASVIDGGYPGENVPPVPSLYQPTWITSIRP